MTAPTNAFRTAARPLAGAAILAGVIWRVGTGPFIDGVRMINMWSLTAAVAIGVVTTLCCAWRWSVVSHGLGVGLPVRGAVAAYYRSQFMNTTLPGGVLGDIHRGLRHGRDVGDVGGGIRAVVWERSAGQGVQIAITVIVLLLLPSPVRASMPIAALAVMVVAVAVLLLSRTAHERAPSRLPRFVHALGTDLRRGVVSARTWPVIVLASAIVVAGHTGTFLIAAKTAGLAASPIELVPLALIVLLAMALPLSVGGWGPREGVAAWAFAMAGLTAAAGVTTAVIYGVLALAASLPGAVLLLIAWRRDATAFEGVARV